MWGKLTKEEVHQILEQIYILIQHNSTCQKGKVQKSK